MAYASYSEGFRSGFPQGPYLNVPGFPSVGPDNLKNYELGTKGEFLDGHVNFDAAVYYIDWTGIQQQILTQTTSGGVIVNFNATVNGAAASGFGAEFALGFRPARGLNFGVNFSWSGLTLDSDVVSGTSLLFKKGDRLVNSPKYTAGATADYAFSLGNGYEGRLSGSVNYVSQREFRGLINGVSGVAQGDKITTSQVSFSVKSPDRWTITAFADNLNDEKGSPVAFVVPNPVYFSRIRPRTVGLQVGYSF